MTSQKRAVDASAAQLDYLQKRWELLPGEDGNGALMLDNLLTAQERLVLSENAYTQAWITYNLAIINHQRATGELLQAQNIAWGDYIEECEGLPTRMLHKSP
jgi:outer membrane protein TolC